MLHGGVILYWSLAHLCKLYFLIKGMLWRADIEKGAAALLASSRKARANDLRKESNAMTRTNLQLPGHA
jgi:hypothetical protein